jgi:DNA end-binding protein Ku
MAARAIGTRTISFGLVSIPVKLYATVEHGKSISFRLLDGETHERLRQQYFRPSDGKIVERDDMVKGYEFAKEQYVVFTKDELDALAQESNTAIAISEFVPLDRVDPVYFDSALYLGPDRGGERAYRLLNEALRRTKLCAIAQYAARGKQYLSLIRPMGTGLVLQQLHYTYELRGFDEVPYDDPGSVNDAELNLAVQLIEQTAQDEFHPEKYTDTVYERAQAAIEQKVAGKEIAIEPVEGVKTQVIDLMAALKASLGQDAEGGSKKAKRSPRTASDDDEQERASN